MQRMFSFCAATLEGNFFFKYYEKKSNVIEYIKMITLLLNDNIIVVILFTAVSKILCKK